MSPRYLRDLDKHPPSNGWKFSQEMYRRTLCPFCGADFRYKYCGSGELYWCGTMTGLDGLLGYRQSNKCKAAVGPEVKVQTIPEPDAVI